MKDFKQVNTISHNLQGDYLTHHGCGTGGAVSSLFGSKHVSIHIQHSCTPDIKLWMNRLLR